MLFRRPSRFSVLNDRQRRRCRVLNHHVFSKRHTVFRTATRFSSRDVALSVVRPSWFYHSTTPDGKGVFLVTYGGYWRPNIDFSLVMELFKIYILAQIINKLFLTIFVSFSKIFASSWDAVAMAMCRLLQTTQVRSEKNPHLITLRLRSCGQHQIFIFFFCSCQPYRGHAIRRETKVQMWSGCISYISCITKRSDLHDGFRI